MRINPRSKAKAGQMNKLGRGGGVKERKRNGLCQQVGGHGVSRLTPEYIFAFVDSEMATKN